MKNAIIKTGLRLPLKMWEDLQCIAQKTKVERAKTGIGQTTSIHSLVLIAIEKYLKEMNDE